MTEEEELEFEREHGIEVRAGGSVTIARWGMGLGILFLAIAFASFLLAYFYLRLEAPVWPPSSVSNPDLFVAGRNVALIVLAAGAAVAGLSAIQNDSVTRMRVFAASAVLLGSAALVSQVVTIGGLQFSSQDHAYGSVFHVISGFMVVVAFGAVLMAAMVLAWSFRIRFSPRRHVSTLNLARFWLATAVFWIAGHAVLGLTPVLT